MNMQVKPQATYGGAGLLGGYDDSMSSGESIANPLVTSLLAQSPQGMIIHRSTLHLMVNIYRLRAEREENYSRQSKIIYFKKRN